MAVDKGEIWKPGIPSCGGTSDLVETPRLTAAGRTWYQLSARSRASSPNCLHHVELPVNRYVQRLPDGSKTVCRGYEWDYNRTQEPEGVDAHSFDSPRYS